MKRERRREGNIWWWNEQVKEASLRKNEHRVMCRENDEENKNTYFYIQIFIIHIF